MGKVGKKKVRRPKPKKKEAKAPQSPRILLLDEDGDASRKFKQVLIQLFSRFDTDGDRVLSVDELKAFSRAANVDEREFTAEEIDEVQTYFDWKGAAPGGGLT